MYENCSTVNELIEEIYKNCLSIKLYKEDNAGELFGFYLGLKSLPKNKINKLPQMKRLFYNVATKASRIYGATNESDYPNQFSEGLMYVYMCLSEVFNGEVNNKLNEDIRCYSLDDAKRILNDEKLCSQLCSYTITYVDMKFKTLAKSKSNPDYYQENKKYVRINYNYLDDENAEIKYNDLFHEEQINETGDLSSYILETYWDELTPKQQIWCCAYMEFGTDKQGNICDLDNNQLYYKQENVNYRNNIRKRLEKLIKDDQHIDYANNGRMSWRN